MWIKWTEAMQKNMIGTPKENDDCLIHVGSLRRKRSYIARVSKVLSSRKFMVRYKIPEEVRHLFKNDENTAIVKLDQMSAFFGMEENNDNDDDK